MMTQRPFESGSDEPSNTLAAVFATESDARNAIKELHKNKFRTTWLGKLLVADRSTGEPMVEGSGGGIARFLSGGDDRRPLHRTLIDRGLTESQARDIEDNVAAGVSIVTVYGEDNPVRAQEILEDAKGDVVADASNAPAAVTIASQDPRTGVETERGEFDLDDDEDVDADEYYESQTISGSAGVL